MTVQVIKDRIMFQFHNGINPMSKMYTTIKILLGDVMMLKKT